METSRNSHFSFLYSFVSDILQVEDSKHYYLPIHLESLSSVIYVIACFYWSKKIESDLKKWQVFDEEKKENVQI